jgi:hypothetical protein
MTTTAVRGSKHECPKCNSADTARAEAIYMQQTQVTTGTGITTDGDSIGVGTFSGKSSSLMASSNAPPSPQTSPARAFVIGGFLGFALFAIAGFSEVGDDSAKATGLFVLAGALLVTALACLPAALKAARFNKRELPLLIAKWRKHWICRRCGYRWIPASE